MWFIFCWFLANFVPQTKKTTVVYPKCIHYQLQMPWEQMFLPLKGNLKIFFGHYSMIQISVLCTQRSKTPLGSQKHLHTYFESDTLTWTETVLQELSFSFRNKCSPQSFSTTDIILPTNKNKHSCFFLHDSTKILFKKPY